MGVSSLDKLKKIPFGLTPEENAERMRIFSAMDVNGNGYLSLAEIDKGVRDVLDIPELFDSKPAMMRAFQAAKMKVKGKKPHSDDYVSRGEFRFLLIYLRQYYYYWTCFNAIDSSHDRRINAEEFKRAVPMMAQWGVKVPDPDTTFKEILTKHGEVANITFTDFCDWAICCHMGYHGDSVSHDF